MAGPAKMEGEMNSEVWIDKQFAEIREAKGLKTPNENGIRIYCTQFPDTWTLQIRTHAPITEYGNNGIKRDMIASVTIGIEELEQMLGQMKSYINAPVSERVKG